ncbi:hypothetical protein Tco_1563382 [Tanacetum coccineum]
MDREVKRLNSQSHSNLKVVGIQEEVPRIPGNAKPMHKKYPICFANPVIRNLKLRPIALRTKLFLTGKDITPRKLPSRLDLLISSSLLWLSLILVKALKWYLEMILHAPLKDMVLLNVMFDEKRGFIFNSNKEVVMIAPRIRDVYVLDMTTSTQESSFFAKASESLMRGRKGLLQEVLQSPRQCT